jgi:hypothetical protein
MDMVDRSVPVAKKKWVQKATANSHGQFRKKAEAAGETTRQFATEHAGDPGLIGKQARLAKTLMGIGGSKKFKYKSKGK